MRDVEKIVELTLKACPALQVRQLTVHHPGVDDDGLWFFNQPDSPFEVQIESPTGMCPFLVETNENDNRFIANSVEETVQAVSKLLHLGQGRES